jgi:ABC-type molybdate transport system substrate-binding protein
MFQAFEGIQVFLSGGGSSLSLNSVGRAVSCQNNVLAPNTYITQVQLAYNANGVTFIKFTTNTAVIFSRGVITQTDSAFTQLFTQTQPFIGVLGYQNTLPVLTSIGFYTFQCMPVQNTTNFTNNDTTNPN